MRKTGISKGLMLFILCWLFLGMFVGAADRQIYDEGSLLTSDQVESLTGTASRLRDDYSMNILVVTTDDAGGKSAKDYADDFYMDHGFYDNENKGGITLLIDMDNRELWVSTAGDMRYYLTDLKREAVADAGYDQVSEGNYYGAFADMLGLVGEYLEQGIDGNTYLYNEETGEITRYRSLRPAEAGAAFLAALVVAGLSGAVVLGKYKMKYGVYKYPYKEKTKLRLNVRNDQFRNKIVTTRRIPRNPPPGSGGSGGGGGGRSSFHTSSGGGSFGGSGRKF